MVRSYVRRRSVMQSLGSVGLGTLAATLAACAPRPGAAPTPSPPLASAPPSPTSLPPATSTTAPTPAPRPTATVPPARPTPLPSPTALPVTPSPRATPGKPRFSNVAQRTPADVLLYLQGRLPGYPEGSPQTEVNFSPSDILETMDTIVLDQVKQREGSAALERVYEVIAHDILTTLREQYANHWVVLALDAGHGGNKAFYWDPGSEGTEALHTRGVAASIQAQTQQPDFARIIVRPIFNDAIADDFGPTAPINRPSINMTLIRQVRASMLALEAAAWNRAYPDAASQVMVHEISVHFNVGANGALVLHQGNTVRPEFVARSIDFAKRYLPRATTDLNAMGSLPLPLTLWNEAPQIHATVSEPATAADQLLRRPCVPGGLARRGRRAVGRGNRLANLSKLGRRRATDRGHCPGDDALALGYARREPAHRASGLATARPSRTSTNSQLAP